MISAARLTDERDQLKDKKIADQNTMIELQKQNIEKKVKISLICRRQSKANSKPGRLSRKVPAARR
jgi:hypothetical protein